MFLRRRPSAAKLRRAVLAAAILLLLPGAHAEEDPRARLQAIEADLGRLESWLASSREDREALQDELRRGDLALSALARESRDAETRLREQRGRIERLGREIGELEEREQVTRETLQAAIRRAWLVSRRGPLQLLLESERPDQVSRLLVYHEQLAEQRIAALEGYRNTRRELETRRTELAQAEAGLRERRDVLAERVERLDAARRNRARSLARLEAEIDTREADRSELMRTRTQLEELLERLAREVFEPTGDSFAANRGQLPWPVEGGIAEAFANSSGRNRGGGVLLTTDPGSTVRAIHPGRVVFADWMRGFGLLIILDHGGGYMSLYAQAELLLRRPGDMVEAGEPLATAGQSGGSTRPGVFFGIRKDGKAEDPAHWCRARGRG